MLLFSLIDKTERHYRNGLTRSESYRFPYLQRQYMSGGPFQIEPSFVPLAKNPVIWQEMFDLKALYADAPRSTTTHFLTKTLFRVSTEVSLQGFGPQAAARYHLNMTLHHLIWRHQMECDQASSFHSVTPTLKVQSDTLVWQLKAHWSTPGSLQRARLTLNLRQPVQQPLLFLSLCHQKIPGCYLRIIALKN